MAIQAQAEVRAKARVEEEESRRWQWGTFWRYVAVVTIVFVALAPLYWTFVTSIKSGTEVTTSPPTLFPQSFVLDNYVQVMTSSFFLSDLRNSAVVSAVSTILALVFGVLCAYAIARMKFLG